MVPQDGDESVRIAEEKTIGLKEAAALLPPGRGGRPITPSCLSRWIVTGFKTRSGQVVRLEAVRVGSRWATSAEALQRFLEAMTAGALAPSK